MTFSGALSLTGRVAVAIPMALLTASLIFPSVIGPVLSVAEKTVVESGFVVVEVLTQVPLPDGAAAVASGMSVRPIAAAAASVDAVAVATIGVRGGRPVMRMPAPLALTIRLTI